MAFSPRTEEELRYAGYVPVDEEDAADLRALGVPLVQRGLALQLAGSEALYWAPSWAVRLCDEWPLNDLHDYDSFRLKQTVRWIARTARHELIDAILTTARLGGEQAVETFISNYED